MTLNVIGMKPNNLPLYNQPPLDRAVPLHGLLQDGHIYPSTVYLPTTQMKWHRGPRPGKSACNIKMDPRE